MLTNLQNYKFTNVQFYKFYKLTHLQVNHLYKFLISQLGVALGFVIPVSVVQDQNDPAKIILIGTDLFNMFLYVAIVTSVIFVLIVVCKSLTLPNLT